MARGRLRVYLGAAPGVGKTYAMLGEGRRRLEREAPTWWSASWRPTGALHTAEMTDGLEIVPRRELTLPRRPCSPRWTSTRSCAAAPRWPWSTSSPTRTCPARATRSAGRTSRSCSRPASTSISTVNIQHLESVNDVVAKITGVPQRETVPDAVVRAADQVELVDMAPEALRRRMAHGNVYAPEKVDAALSNYFRVGNLTALRELALLWTADKVDEALQHYRVRARDPGHLGGTGAGRGRAHRRPRGRDAGPAGRADRGTLDRGRAARRARDPVRRPDRGEPGRTRRQRRLVESLGGTYHQVLGDDIPEALLTFARAENATQLVLGASRRSWLQALLTGPGIGAGTIRDSGDIDVHIVTHSETGRGARVPRLRGNLTRRRRLQGLALAVVLPPLLTLLLVPQRSALNLVSDVLIFLVAVIGVALVGGFVPGLLAAVVASHAAQLLLHPAPAHPRDQRGQQRTRARRSSSSSR